MMGSFGASSSSHYYRRGRGDPPRNKPDSSPATENMDAMEKFARHLRG